MKNYGVKKATEFSKKDLSPIYKMAKNGELQIEKWFINELYTLADYYGFDDNGFVAREEKEVMNIINAENKQELINEVTEKWFGRLSLKNQQSCDRNFVK